MSDFYINNIPQHIMYNGNLYVLVEQNIPIVDDVAMDSLKGKCERNKAIDDVLEKLYKYYHDVSNGKKYAQYDHYCNGVDDCIDIVEQLKVGVENDD